MQLKADLHTHTIASGHAFSTIKELAEGAKRKGLELIAITDHGITMPGGPHPYYFSQLVSLPGEIDGVKILKGVEANIIDCNGSLDMPENLLKKLDLVLASFHTDTGYQGKSIEENTRAMISAIQNPYVHIISHPGNPEFPVDLEKVVYAARMSGKALEINNNSLLSLSRPGSAPRCDKLARLAAKTDTFISINSDAHSCFSVGNCDLALQLAEKAGIKASRVLNTSVEFVEDYIKVLKKKLRRIC
ncbi:phosphatase [Desulforamulus aeronauticus]|uniref:Putative hydrolase n=1 Tax=Desulforamulus aeronauticus DSM 10349 TaxID=1121421 RepID=A0A1M6UWC0_9FIRM|nr:phosphatase [Desulforamulus aeronauticus]SHK73376.1 putative hydrolase [Desulforamulus aeronauticus DSM 10349]